MNINKYVRPYLCTHAAINAYVGLQYSAVYYYSAPVGEQSIAISLSACLSASASISLEPLDRSSRSFLCRFLVAVARFSSGGVATCYILPVSSMTSHWAVTGRMAMRERLKI